VYRCAECDSLTQCELVGTTTDTSFIDYLPAPAQPIYFSCGYPQRDEYCYYVVALNDCGSSEPSASDLGYVAGVHDEAGALPKAGHLGDLLVLVTLLVAIRFVLNRRTRRAKNS